MMRRAWFALVFLIPIAACTQPVPSALMPFDVSDHRWTHRLLLVFAPTDEHPDLLAQRQAATGYVDGLQDRDLLLVYVLEQGTSVADNRPINEASAVALRERYGIVPGDFVVLLIGKDGTEKRRSEQPVTIESVFDQIDQMPMRQREMESRGGG